MPANLFPLGLAALGGLGRGIVAGQEAEQTMQYRQLQMQQLQQQMALERLRQQQMAAAGAALRGGLGGGGMGGWGPQMNPYLGGGYQPMGGPRYGPDSGVMPPPAGFQPYAPGQIAAEPLAPLQAPLMQPTQIATGGAPPSIGGTGVPGAPDDPRFGGVGLGPHFDATPHSAALGGDTSSMPSDTDLPSTGAQGPGGAIGPTGPMGAAGDQPMIERTGYMRVGPTDTSPAARAWAWNQISGGDPFAAYQGPSQAQDPYGGGWGYPATIPSGYGGGYGGALPQDPFTAYRGDTAIGPSERAVGFRGRPVGFRGFPTEGGGMAPGLGTVANAIYGLESSWGRNPNVWQGAAKGPMQITGGTFARYAQPGEDIFNPADNMRVGNRIISDLWRKSGGDPSAVLVGYNAGEGAMRTYQSSGDDPRSVRLEPAYQRAVAQAREGQFRTSLNADMSTMMSPQDRSYGGISAQRTLGAMPNPLAMSGRMTMGGLAQAIAAANPGVSDTVLMGAFSMLYPMLENQQRYDFQTQWQQYVEREKEREFEVTHAEREQEFGIRMQEQYAPKFGAPEDFKITTPDGQTQTISGMPITSGRGAGQIVTQDPKSGEMRPISTVYPGASYTRAPLRETTGTVHEEMIQTYDQDGNPVRTVRVIRDPSTGKQTDADDPAGKEFKIDPSKGEVRSAQVTPGGLMAERRRTQGPLSPSAVQYYAKLWNETGYLPPGIARSSAAMAQLMNATGFEGTPGDFAVRVASQKADAASLRAATNIADSATRYENVAIRNFETALKLADQGIPTGFGPALNRWIQNGETQFGTTGPAAYTTALLTAANEYAKVMQGSTGAQGATVDARREAAELFNPAYSAEQIKANIAVAKRDMENKKEEAYDTVEAIKDRLRHPGAPAVPPEPGAGPMSQRGREAGAAAPQVPIAGAAPPAGAAAAAPGAPPAAARPGPQLQPIPVPPENANDPDGPYDNGWTKRGGMMYPPGQ